MLAMLGFLSLVVHADTGSLKRKDNASEGLRKIINGAVAKNFDS